MFKTLKDVLCFIYSWCIPHFRKDVIAVKYQPELDAYQFLFAVDQINDVPASVIKSADGYVTVSVFCWGPLMICLGQSAELRETP